MYIPKSFEINDTKEIYDFIHSNAFGQLICNVNGRPFVTHVPFLLSEDNTKLIGHLAKNNPQLKHLEQNEVLVTFQGAHAYISPSWFENSLVPTWNYQAAHVYGSCKIFSEPSRLKSCVDSLTKKYEAGFSNPWKPDYDTSMLSVIVGFEISISEIQCQFKLSQNKSTKNQESIINHLKEHDSAELAFAMEQNLKKQHKKYDLVSDTTPAESSGKSSSGLINPLLILPFGGLLLLRRRKD